MRTLRITEKLFFTLRMLLISGVERQSFLDSFLVSFFIKFIRVLPATRQGFFTLFAISLSPHYFYNRKVYSSYSEFLTQENHRINNSRSALATNLNKQFGCANLDILDYGCGMGWLCNNLLKFSPRSVMGVDMSTNVISLARILHPDPRLQFESLPNFKNAHEDKQFDLVTAIAVTQHMSEERLREFFKVINLVMKDEGRLLIHFMTESTGALTESEWLRDRSIQGRIKLRIGLHCFARTYQDICTLGKEFNLQAVTEFDSSSIIENVDDDVSSEEWILFRKKIGY